MKNSEKEKHGETEAPSAVALVLSALRTAANAQGRHGIRIFAVSGNTLAMFAVGGIIVGIPMALFVALLPFWDHVGEFELIRTLNAYVAPGIESIPDVPLPEFPVKRYLIASTTMIELLFLGNFIALFALRPRRHALLVWTYYDRAKIFQYFGISALLFFCSWYVLFYDWETLAYLNTWGRPSMRAPGPRLVILMAVSLPIVAFVFGHLASIVGLGAWRTASKKLRRTGLPRPR